MSDQCPDWPKLTAATVDISCFHIWLKSYYLQKLFQFGYKISLITWNLSLFIHLQINGRPVDNKTVQEAIQIIGLSKDKVTMRIKKDGGGTVSIPAQRFQPSEATPEHKATKDESDVEESPAPSRRSSTSKESDPE